MTLQELFRELRIVRSDPTMVDAESGEVYDDRDRDCQTNALRCHSPGELNL